MPAGTIKSYNTFVKGIITEAGPLSYPENASIDEENCVLNRDGSRQRRLGIDYEAGFEKAGSIVSHPEAWVGCLRWHDVGSDPDVQFAVVQAGTTLYVYDATASSVSANLVDSIDISAYTDGRTPVQAANGMGFFICTAGSGDPFYLEYDPAGPTITLFPITLLVRDFWGVEDGLDVDEFPPTLSTEHNYNLKNQGWKSAEITSYHSGTGDYPANNQQWFIGKDADDVFQPDQLEKTDFGSTPAPNGRFIISPFTRSTDRDLKSGLTTPVDIDTTRPSSIGFAFQRVFYSGCVSVSPLPAEKSPNLTGFIFFSRTLQNAGDMGQCYSDADPTSEVDSILVDTDGGYVIIPDSGKIHKLVPKNDAVIVLAEQGVWAIMGGADGFRATSFQVVKISDFGVLSGTSVVDAEENIFYWNRGGIYVVTAGQGGFPTTQSISETSIQTLYNKVNQPAKKWAVGSYDPINRRVSWLYSDDEDYAGVTFKNKYNKELVLDMVLSAYYKNALTPLEEDVGPFLAGYFTTPDFLLREEGVRDRGESITKYLCIQYTNPGAEEIDYTFGYYRNASFRDWYSEDAVGVSFLSYMITGYEILGDIARDKQAPRVFMHYKRTETAVEDDGDGGLVFDNPSGMKIQAQWDWSNGPDSGKWGDEWQGYRYTNPYTPPTVAGPISYAWEVVTTNTRVPGWGKSLSLYMKSDEDKDFYLYGWAIKYTGVTNV